MNKSKATMDRRIRDIKKEVWSSKACTKTVQKIAYRLYLSESTIWKDALSDQ